jgi:3-deoxy-alpha-D-manno-octulosonate 8-oxidase
MVMPMILDAEIKNNKNILRYVFGEGSINQLSSILARSSLNNDSGAIYLIDQYFEANPNILGKLPVSEKDAVIYVNTEKEPTTDYINGLMDSSLVACTKKAYAIIGIGGGTTLDTAKAVSNLLTNLGRAEDYQGWDLVKMPGVFKVGIPTISGTGAEATRTCVMTHPPTGLKLGMNSDHTVFDQLILDPNLTKTVPLDQYFYTGMDAYIHCVEALNGHYRNAVGDAFSNQVIRLCREVFLSDNIKSDNNRGKLMVASYLGGCAVATTFVGVIHPFSAGLSVVLGIHHGLANCIAMTAMGEFYPRELEEFWCMVKKQNIHIPKGVCKHLSREQYDLLYESTIIHKKPLTNALGSSFENILTKNKVEKIFKSM